MSAPRWEEYSRLILTKLDEHGKKLDAIQSIDRVSLKKAAFWGAISGAVAGVLMGAPQKAGLLGALLKALSG